MEVTSPHSSMKIQTTPALATTHGTRDLKRNEIEQTIMWEILGRSTWFTPALIKADFALKKNNILCLTHPKAASTTQQNI